MPQEITVPDLGDFHDVEVIDVLVKPGDKIEVDTPLLTIETEKATMDVPSTTAGVVKSVSARSPRRANCESTSPSFFPEAWACARAALKTSSSKVTVVLIH
jgi:glycine cleavage system H lipoate-binding protein